MEVVFVSQGELQNHDTMHSPPFGSIAFRMYASSLDVNLLLAEHLKDCNTDSELYWMKESEYNEEADGDGEHDAVYGVQEILEQIEGCAWPCRSQGSLPGRNRIVTCR